MNKFLESAQSLPSTHTPTLQFPHKHKDMLTVTRSVDRTVCKYTLIITIVDLVLDGPQHRRGVREASKAKTLYILYESCGEQFPSSYTIGVSVLWWVGDRKGGGIPGLHVCLHHISCLGVDSCLCTEQSYRRLRVQQRHTQTGIFSLQDHWNTNIY